MATTLAMACRTLRQIQTSSQLLELCRSFACVHTRFEHVCPAFLSAFRVLTARRCILCVLHISFLQTIGELQAALTFANDANQLVALKFKRNNCAACASTVEDFAALAEEYGDAGQFYEVSWEDSKDFMKRCQLKAVPSGHIYGRGELQSAMALNAKKWTDFRTECDAVRDSFCALAA